MRTTREEQTTFPWAPTEPLRSVREPTVIPEGISPGRRRTLIQQGRLRGGLHPLKGAPLSKVPGATCGTCHFAIRRRLARNTVWKCRQWASLSAASDIRVSWPGCNVWKPRERIPELDSYPT